jgi:hypothetical protein
MAAIGPKRSRVRRLSALAQAMLLLAGATGSRADQSADIRARLNEIASSLTAGDPASAIVPFSSAYANYQKLRDYFSGLTNSFSIVNEVEVLDEADSKTQSTATISWTLTLSNPVNNFNTQRSAEIHVRFIREQGKWKVVEFSPIGIFDPSQAQTPTNLIRKPIAALRRHLNDALDASRWAHTIGAISVGAHAKTSRFREKCSSGCDEGSVIECAAGNVSSSNSASAGSSVHGR